MEFVELGSDVSVKAIDSSDLAYLFSISGGVELTGVDLTEAQWAAIAARSRRDDWSPQWLSIEGMRDMEGLWNSQAEVAVVISNTKQVWLSELELDRWDLWSVDEISEDLLKRCKKLQIWFSRSNFLSLSDEQQAVLYVASQLMSNPRVDTVVPITNKPSWIRGHAGVIRSRVITIIVD